MKKIFDKNEIELKEFIDLCLYSDAGFYNSDNAFGRAGSFVTSPMISSIFGEIIALFMVNIVQNNPLLQGEIDFIEVGGGDGALLSDFIRIFNKFFPKRKNITFFSLEKSKKNIDLQKKILPSGVKYIQSLDDLVEKCPKIIISNELFDAYPVNQYIFDGVWKKLMVRREEGDKFTPFLAKTSITPELEKYIQLAKITDISNAIVEVSTDAIDDFERMCKIIDDNFGIMLHFDYGFFKHENKSTLQGIKNHEKTDIYSNPTKTDITHLVNFDIYYQVVKNKIPGTRILELSTQGRFLTDIGIHELVKIYTKNSKSFQEKRKIFDAVNRLTDSDKMGDLFKVLFVAKV